MSILTTLTGGIYKYIAIAGIALGLAVGGYFYGHHVGAEESKITIANFENKVTTQDNQINSLLTPESVQIATEFVTKTVHIKDTGKTNDQIITNTVIDKQLLSRGWVRAHDSSAAGEPVNPTTSADATPSTITAVDALKTINDNYTSCNQYREQIIGLQQYINGYNAAVESIQKKK